MHSTMLGYRVAKHGDTRVILTLEISEDALTNLRRPGIAFAETATYRTNKAKVLAIEDAEGNHYSSAESYQFPRTYLFIVGEIIKEPDFDPRLEEIFAEGIHFFLNRRVAELYGLQEMNDGVFTRWHLNGQKSAEGSLVHGQKHGLYQEWYENGQIMKECTYVDGKLEGIYSHWFRNGQKQEEGSYLFDKLEGLYTHWFNNGQKHYEVTYRENTRHGTCHEWYTNGQKHREMTYDSGALHGLYHTWHPSGAKIFEALYEKGTCVGGIKAWTQHGVPLD